MREAFRQFGAKPKRTPCSAEALRKRVLRDGSMAALESPEAGEVVWCDDAGVTCRRWNWRQGIRTRLCAEDAQMWFILESLPAMPLEELHAAGKMLTDGLTEMMPGAEFSSTLING